MRLIPFIFLFILTVFVSSAQGTQAALYEAGDRIVSIENTVVRSAPDDKQLFIQRKGSYGTIVSGPVIKSGYEWWKIDYDSGVDGWSAGFLFSLADSGVTEDILVPNSFVPGDRVLSVDNLVVRSTPNGTKLYVQAEGTLGTVISGPEEKAGYTWWKIDYDIGADGWSADSWITGVEPPVIEEDIIDPPPPPEEEEEILLPSYEPWTSYLGIHYNTIDWVNILRDHKFGLNITDIQPLTDDQKGNLEEFRAVSDMVQIIGGLGSGRDEVGVADYMNGIEADKGATWRKAVADRAREFDEIPGANKIYIQAGNEISSGEMSKNLHLWAGDGKNGQFFDPEVIPWYVEYYLAPTIAGVDEAGVKDMPIVMGSLTVYSNDNAEAWLADMMNYKIEGSYAPSLAGKYVYEVVDIISIHYLMMSDVWESRLDNIKTNWIGKGKVSGVWSTEELGIKAADGGDGGAVSLRVTARYLSWAFKNDYDSEQVRWIFYGWNDGASGSRVKDSLGELYEAVGDSVLTPIETGSEEVYLFDVGGNDQKRISIAWGSYDVDVKEIRIPAAGWSASADKITATASIYGSGNKVAEDVSVTKDGDEYVLSLASSALMSSRGSIHTAFITLVNTDIAGPVVLDSEEVVVNNNQIAGSIEGAETSNMQTIMLAVGGGLVLLLLGLVVAHLRKRN